MSELDSYDQYKRIMIKCKNERIKNENIFYIIQTQVTEMNTFPLVNGVYSWKNSNWNYSSNKRLMLILPNMIIPTSRMIQETKKAKMAYYFLNY